MARRVRHGARRVARGLNRVLAVDWSGARERAHRKIWLAEASLPDRRLVRLESGRDRDALADHLIAEAARDPGFAVGLDFAFSLPGWVLRDRGLSDAPALWQLAAREAEGWLERCEPPFWGRRGRPRPTDLPLERALRRTEREVPATRGVRPKSVLQVGGAGTVGTGSLRGMPVLARLRAAGLAIWPFDPPGWPCALEIYPRLFTGPVRKTDPAARRARLASLDPPLDPALHAAAAGSDDAFDAALSALGLASCAAELEALEPSSDPLARLEGAVFIPAGPAGQRGSSLAAAAIVSDSAREP